jgi:transposase
MDFLAKNSVTKLEHPPYSPDLATVDFYVFRRLKSAWKSRRFCDAIDIVKNATEELKSLPGMASRNDSTVSVAGRSV